MAKRIAQSSVNWAALSERVPPELKGKFITFKAKSDGYLRRVLANPAELPKLDWALYKNKVPVAGMVETFQKQYESLQIPFPTDNYTKLVDALEAESKNSIAKYVADSNERIAKLQKEIAVIEALIPYAEMTMEDFRDAHPDLALDPINNPTFWPHYEDGQPGQVKIPGEDH